MRIRYLIVSLLCLSFLMGFSNAPKSTLADIVDEAGNAGKNTPASLYRAANFQVLYRNPANAGTCDAEAGTVQTWPVDAQAAMNYVIDILDDLINSPVPITVEACYQQDPDPQSDTLAAAGPTMFLTQSTVPTLPKANREYAVALANAISGADQNGTAVEIGASANSRVNWDFCTEGCTVAADQADFVSTMIHELLHGLGFFASFDADNPTNPTAGSYTTPPATLDEYLVQVSDGTSLLTIANNSEALLNAMRQGSGTIGFNGPAVLAINGNRIPFFYTPQQWESGSSMSHWDDSHPSNLGRMMNAATNDGPSSRVVSAITLAALKDIGWSVNDASDRGDREMSAYGDAHHINAPTFTNHIKLGSAFSTEATAKITDESDDGVTRPTTWTTGVGGGEVTANVVSSTPGARGCLSGWVDWNNDGDLDDLNEQIANMLPVGVGNQTVNFDIPASANNPAIFFNTRVRLLPDWDNDGICSDQVAIDASVGVVGGEVEDYRWSLSGGTVQPPPTNIIFLPAVVN